MVIIKNTKDKTTDQILIIPTDINGKKPIIKKKIKNNIPKVILFFLLILISCFCPEIGTVISLI
jgi:uncharacterized protein YlzI (FlbEa/FlbD family)